MKNMESSQYKCRFLYRLEGLGNNCLIQKVTGLCFDGEKYYGRICCDIVQPSDFIPEQFFGTFFNKEVKVSLIEFDETGEKEIITRNLTVKIDHINLGTYSYLEFEDNLKYCQLYLDVIEGHLDLK